MREARAGSPAMAGSARALILEPVSATAHPRFGDAGDHGPRQVRTVLQGGGVVGKGVYPPPPCTITPYQPRPR
jgi:hypothetical protein